MTATSGSFARLDIAINDGSLYLYGAAQLRLGPEPYHATLNYNNSSGNLEIAARSSYNVDITHGDLLITEGKIGINNASPTQKLVVGGTISGSGDLKLGGSVTVGPGGFIKGYETGNYVYHV